MINDIGKLFWGYLGSADKYMDNLSAGFCTPISIVLTSTTGCVDVLYENNVHGIPASSLGLFLFKTENPW